MRFTFTGILFFLLFDALLAQEAAIKPETGYLKSFITDAGSIAIQPLHWKTNEWLAAGGSALVFTALYLNDEQIQSFFQSNRTSTTNVVSTHFAEPLGSGLFVLPALGLFYGSGWLFENEKSRHVALQAGKAWVLTAGATVVLKQVIHRQRPNEGDFPNARVWRGPYAFTRDYTSFPSGHTSTAFAVATVIADSYADKWYIGAGCYTLATLAGLSRIHENMHWASDVFAGALLGFWVGRSILRMHPRLHVGASAGGGQYSGRVVIKF